MAKEREGRSERGVSSFIRALCTDGMGLSTKATDDIVKVIKAAGEMSGVKKHIRTMGGMTYKRFNQALDMAEEAMQTAEDNADVADDGPEDKKKEEVKEGKITFMEHLLNELSPLDVGTQLTPDRETLKKQSRKSDVVRKREAAAAHIEQKKSQDPIDKQIAMARERLATLMKKKEMQSSKGM